MGDGALKSCILTYGWRGIFAVLLIFFMVFCSGDSCPEHEKTWFDGWERPIFLPVPDETEETNPPQDTEKVTTFESASSPLEVAPDPHVIIGEKITTEGDERCLFPVLIKITPETNIFGILLMLYTEPQNHIYGLTVESIPEGLHFSYIIDNNRAVVLLDGILSEDQIASDAVFYVVAEDKTQWIGTKIVEVMEKT